MIASLERVVFEPLGQPTRLVLHNCRERQEMALSLHGVGAMVGAHADPTRLDPMLSACVSIVYRVFFFELFSEFLL